MPLGGPTCPHFYIGMQSTNTDNAVEAATSELAAYIDDADGFVKAARAALARLCTLNEAECRRTSEQCAELESKIVKVSTHHVKMATKKRCKEGEIDEHTSQLSALGSRIHSLHANIDNLHSTIRQANEQIADNNRRQSNALYDLIPLHGIFSAIISGDAKRAIPYYSQVDGIISVIENNKAEAEHRLRCANEEKDELVRQRDATQQLINHAREVLENVQRELSECGATIKSCERLRTTIGQHLTTTQSARSQLEILATRYEFLNRKINLVAAVPNKLVLQHCLNDFRALRLLQA